MENIVSIIHSGDAGDALLSVEDTAAPPARRLVPEFMLQLARRVSPF